MTWASNYGATHRSLGSLDTKRAKRITKTCLDCPAVIDGPGKKRCAPCYAAIMQVRAAANSKRQSLAKKAKNGAIA